ncbi:MAG: TM1812 family CRISPR-associated protein [Haliscomenobacter sp.]|nr:TM1812 family CRISPR-associated protein [Haliscomenobacter sp.]
MPRTFISFLGANDYLPTRYYRRADRSDLTTPLYYVQEAILASIDGPWTSEDSIWIFTTAEAREKNYHNRVEKRGEILHRGDRLEAALIRLKMTGRIAQYDAVDIPNGYTQPEIWAVFETVLNKLRPNDEVIMDITYGFRSLPMLALVLLIMLVL